MQINNYLKQACVMVNHESTDKEDLIVNLVETIVQNYQHVDRDEAIKALFERENLETTGIGKGIALPHARINSCTDVTLALATLKEPIDFNSLDDNPVKLVLLILTPKDDVKLQLRFLARVSRLFRMDKFINSLVSSKNSGELIANLKKFEDNHFH